MSMTPIKKQATPDGFFRGESVNLIITTRCNMLCQHCYLSCTHEGEDIDMDLLERAISWAAINNYAISITGGEPTIHPDFWQIVGLCLRDAAARNYILQVTTNGSSTETALRLAAMAKGSQLIARLSLDEWHQPIDKKVVNAFCKEKWGNLPDYTHGDLRAHTAGVMEVTGIAPFGRGATLPKEKQKMGPVCCSAGIVRAIYPNGNVTACLCCDAPIIGNLLDQLPPYSEISGCAMGRRVI